MNADQQKRLMELGVAWQKVDGRTLDATAEISVRRKFMLARLEAALEEMHALALDTEFVLVPGGYAGHPEQGYAQVNLGLKLAGHDYGSDGEQSLSFYFREDSKVVVQRSIVTRSSGSDLVYVPPTQEAEVSFDNATVSWFIDRMLDFMAEKIANPRPSGLPLEKPVKAADGKGRFTRTGRIMTLGWKVMPVKTST